MLQSYFVSKKENYYFFHFAHTYKLAEIANFVQTFLSMQKRIKCSYGFFSSRYIFCLWVVLWSTESCHCGRKKKQTRLHCKDILLCAHMSSCTLSKHAEHSFHTLGCSIPCHPWHSEAAELRFKRLLPGIQPKSIDLWRTDFTFTGCDFKMACFKQRPHPFMRPKAFHPWPIGETCLSDERFDLKSCGGVAVYVGTWGCMTGKWEVRKLVVPLALMLFLQGDFQ